MNSEPENLARVVLFDPVTQNLRATRYGLYEAGFRAIEAYHSVADLRARLSAAPTDLLVAESSCGGVHDVVRDLRRGDLAENPFAVVFLTAWRSDTETVNGALHSGADDIMLRPFSTSFIETRIRAAIHARKNFVVTSDYLGPDRRKDSGRESSAKLFSPPNTLKSAVAGDRAALEARAEEIESFKTAMRREQAVRMAVRIGVELQLAVEGERPSSAVHHLARELYETASQTDPEAAKLAAAMVRGLANPEDVRKSFKLARELALAICVICGDGSEGEGDYVAEIESMMKVVKSKPPAAAPQTETSKAETNRPEAPPAGTPRPRRAA